MVQFGFQDLSETGDEDARSQPSLDVYANVHDTFAVRHSSMQMPGSFNFSPQTHQHNPITSSTNVTSLQDEQQTLLNSLEHDDTTGISQAGGDLEMQSLLDSDSSDIFMYDDESAVDDSKHNAGSGETASDLEHSSWYKQLQLSNGRYQILHQAKIEKPRREEKKHKSHKRSACYTSLDLDRDLFRHEGTLPVSESRAHTKRRRDSVPSDRTERSHIYPPAFSFRWTSRGMLMKAKGTAVYELQHKQVSHMTDIPAADHCLKQLLQHSKIHLSDTGVPLAIVQSSLTAAAMTSHEFDEAERSLWQMTSSLFDPVSTLELLTRNVSHHKSMRRKAAFSTWLSTAVSPQVSKAEAIADSAAQIMYTRLTGYQIEEACSLALKHGDFHLATLLPLAGNDQEARDYVRDQVAHWRTNNSTRFINKSYLDIYELLSGTINSHLQAVGVIPEAENETIARLDWRRIFGLYLWYGTPSGSTIDDALEAFGNYLVTAATTSSARAITKQSQADVHYHVIQIYADHDYEAHKFLDVSTYPGNGSSKQLHLWLLCLYLFRLSTHGDSTSNRNFERSGGSGIVCEFDQATIMLADQLSASGAVDWAISVALHTRHEPSRETLLKTILAKNIHKISKDLEFWLNSNFLIPNLWICEARALSLRASSHHREEILCLIGAKLYNEAHATLLNHLAPQSVVCGKFGFTYDILHNLSLVSTIDGWEHGGQVYKDAIDIIHTFQGSSALSEQQRRTMELGQQAHRLIAALPSMQQRTFDQRVARTELTMTLIDLYLKVESEQQSRKVLQDLKDSRSGASLRYRALTNFVDASIAYVE